MLSGLNLGLNLGPAVWHSGTLAAAKQAALLGVRGIALSAPAGIEGDFEPILPWVRRVLQTLLHDAPAVPLVNVNLPREPRGLLWTRASTHGYDGRIVPGVIRWAARSTGSPSSRSRRPRTSRIAGRWSSGGCR